MPKMLRWHGDGSFDGAVVGESHYQKDLKKLAGGERRKPATARLVCEKDNPYDRQAVKVEISGKTIGHLSSDEARAHRRKLKTMKQEGAMVECDAVIVTGREGLCGVYLDLPSDENEKDEEDSSQATVKPAKTQLDSAGPNESIGVNNQIVQRQRRKIDQKVWLIWLGVASVLFVIGLALDSSLIGLTGCLGLIGLVAVFVMTRRGTGV